MKAHEKIRAWRKDPVRFVRENFQIEPDNWQLEVLRLLPSQKPKELRIAMQACVGPGKSALLAWSIWWFMSCLGSKGQHPRGAALSITERNLRDNLWAELAKWRNRSDFLKDAFKWTKTQIFAKQHPSTWFFSARTWNKEADADTQGETLSGLHSEYVMVVFDESGEIPPSVAKTGEQIFSNYKWAKILQAGNPTSREGMLFAADTKYKHLWTVVHITGDPDDPNRSPRINLELAKQAIVDDGRDNPWVMSKILGRFPKTSIKALLSFENVDAAMNRFLKPNVFEFSQKRLGIDAAREGRDSWCIFPRQGLMAFRPVLMRNPTGFEAANRVIAAKNKWGSEIEFFDDTGGFAGAAIEKMREMGYSPIPINFSGKPINPRYANKRAEMWFEMKEWIERGGCLPKNDRLREALTKITYTFLNGKFLLQKKSKLPFSPDEADALALTFALPDALSMSARDLVDGGGKNKMKSEFNPYDEKYL